MGYRCQLELALTNDEALEERVGEDREVLPGPSISPIAVCDYRRGGQNKLCRIALVRRHAVLDVLVVMPYRRARKAGVQDDHPLSGGDRLGNILSQLTNVQERLAPRGVDSFTKAPGASSP